MKNSLFYKATEEFNSYEKHVNAPYIRKDISFEKADRIILSVSGLGFYDLFFNGEKITKGLLAPYISNPDDLVYFDEYDITDKAKENNCIGLILGNGMQNAPGGRVWDFDLARWRSAPCYSITVTYINNGENRCIDIGSDFRCAPSPILFDDLRSGCFYDANLEIKDWNLYGFDDSSWNKVLIAEAPKGERRIADTDAIVITEEIKAKEIREARIDDRFVNRENMRLDTQFKFNKLGQKGIMYDFGVNTAGIFRLKIKGKKGQQIFIQLCEFMNSKGEPSYISTGSFYPDSYGQTALYICKGEENEIFEPSFCYYGYRYAVVFGLEEGQIKDDTIVMLRASSDLKERGSFECSDETMNTLGRMSRISDLANFYYFPTDCPHREKNGWTGDAAVSAEHMLITLTPERSYREWLRSICAAQNESGMLPGIVPTAGWGYEWGNGPAWDNVLTELCYQVYRLRGDLTPATECAEAMIKYLRYINGRRRDDGLIAIGLGDWLQPGRDAGDPVSPLYVTDSVISMYISKKSAILFDALGLEDYKKYASDLYESFREAIRSNIIDFDTMAAKPECQTSQAICLYYGVFNEDEKEKAFKVLLDLIKEKEDHFDCGMIGVRVIFHVLSDFGYGSLAFKMITREDYPSYGSWIKQGLTALSEDFLPPENWDNPNSQDHHFMGDFTSWFIQKVAGLKINSPEDFSIRPDFIEQLTFAKAEYDSPCGMIKVKWSRDEKTAVIIVEAPEAAKGNIIAPEGWKFSDISEKSRELKSGEYKLIKC